MPQVAVQAFAVGAAEARRAAVIDVDDAETARRPVEDLERVLGRRVGGGAAVDRDDQRRQLALGALVVGVRRRVEEGVRGALAAVGIGRRELDRARDRDHPRLQRLALERVQNLIGAGGEIAAHDRRRQLRTVGAEDDLGAARVEGREGVGRVGEGERLRIAAAERQPAQALGRALDPDHRDAGVGERVGRAAEDPVRVAELGSLLGERLWLARGRLPVQVPEAGAVGDEVQYAVGAPARLPDRLGGAAGDMLGGADRAVGRELAAPQLGAVPWHLRVVPLQPRDSGAVRARARARDEVGAAAQQAPLAAFEVDRREHVCDLALGVGLTHADQVPAVGRGAAVGETDRGWGRRLRRDRLRLARGAVGPEADEPQALVGEVREGDAPLDEAPRAAAVLVHPGPGVEVRADHVALPTVGGLMDQRVAAALGGPHLGPHYAAPERVGNELRAGDGDVAAGDALGAERGGPGAVGGGALAHRAQLIGGGGRRSEASPAAVRPGPAGKSRPGGRG